MKKVVYLFAAGTIALAACSNDPAYKISGTIENVADGEYVFLQEAKGRELIKLDSAVVTNGKFTFSGRKDTAAIVYLTSTVSEGKHYTLDFFLENGNITATLGKESAIKGTACNDAYQAYKDGYNALVKESNDLYKMSRNDSITAEQKEEIKKQM